jgi:hypothetical protein
MLGNDQYGDCGAAGLVHGDEVTACIVDLAQKETWPTDQAVIDGYLEYTHGQDSGVVLAQFLNYARCHGFLGKRYKHYAPVEVHDVPTLQTAVFMYGFSYTGIVVTTGMQQASLANNQPWETSQLSTPVAGGHCVPIVGYDDTYLYCVTWGSIQPITYPMWHAISTEAWAVITPEFVEHNGDGRGVSLDALEADLDKLN